MRCSKSAQLCGAKHISKSKCAKHTSLGALLEVEMLKKCTVLWRDDYSYYYYYFCYYYCYYYHYYYY